MTSERVLDLHRYWRMKEKGRVSPRTAASKAAFFSPEKSTIPEKDLKRKENFTTDEPPLSQYINCGTLPVPINEQKPSTIRQRYSLQTQSKEERLRKIGKWEKFRRSRQMCEDVARHAVRGMPYPSEPSVKFNDGPKKKIIDPPLLIKTDTKREIKDNSRRQSAEFMKAKALKTYNNLKGGLQSSEEEIIKRTFSKKVLRAATEGTPTNPICLDDIDSPFPPRIKDAPESGNTNPRGATGFGYTPQKPTSVPQKIQIVESRDEIEKKEDVTEAFNDQSIIGTGRDDGQDTPKVNTNKSAEKKQSVALYNAISQPSDGKDLDIQTVRLVFAKEFSRMIKYEKAKQRKEKPQSNGPSSQICGGNGVSFVVRKRPISKQEIYGGDFDVVSAERGNAGGLTVYETKVLSDLKTKDLKPHTFQCNRFLSETQKTEDFYISVGQPHVSFAKEGGFASFIICGSKGSEKAKSATDLREWAACDIFEPEKIARASGRRVSLQYIELNGKNCYDLLSPGTFLRVIDKGPGYFKVEGAVTKSASSPAGLMKLFSQAKRRLAVRSNVRQESEGNSFILSQMTISEEGRRNSGCLTILECPSGQLNKTKRDKESEPVFDALMTCLSAKISQRSALNPFRQVNNLTKIMKESIENRDSRVCVCLALSPRATDTENSIEALSLIRNVMNGYQRSRVRRSSIIDNNTPQYNDLTLPRQWDHTELADWMKKKNLTGTSSPSKINGRIAMRMSKQQLNNAFYNRIDDDKANRLYASLRSENDRVARLRVKRRMSHQLNSSTS